MKPEYVEYNLMVDKKPQTLKLTKVLDGDLQQLVYEMHEYNQDILIVFDGEEGSGKSHAMKQVGWVLNHHLQKLFGIVNPFSVDNIHYKVLDYIKQSYANKDKIGFINILDEGGDEVDKSASISQEGKRFTRYLRKCRKLRQIHLIAMPSAHDLQKYVALWRQKFIVKMEKERYADPKSPTGKSLRLGKFRIIRNDNRWKYCYMDKTPYKYPRFLHKNKIEKLKSGEHTKYYADHKGKFEYCEVFGAKELEALNEKNIGLAEEYDTMVTKGGKKDTKKGMIEKYLEKNPAANTNDVAELFMVTQRYVQQIQKQASA